MSTIDERGWTPLFATAARVTSAAREQGVTTHPLAGALSWSLVAHVLGISGIDPVKCGAPFERLTLKARPLPHVEVGIGRVALARLLDGLGGREAPVVGEPSEPHGPFDCRSLRFGDAGSVTEVPLLFMPALDEVQRAVDRGLDLAAIDRDNMEPLLRQKSKAAPRGEAAPLASDFGRWLLGRVRPANFEQIIACLALTWERSWLGDGSEDPPDARWRTYLACRLGVREPVPPHPVCEPHLSETFGLVLYQEQVTDIACDLAGMSPGEADHLRRALRQKKPDQLRLWGRRFVRGAIAKAGLTEEEARRVLDTILGEHLGISRVHVAAEATVSLWAAHAAVRLGRA